MILITLGNNMEGNVKRKTVLGIDEVSRLLRDSGIGATNGKINFPNAILRNYARLNKPLPFGVAYAVGMFAIYPMYESLSKDADLASIFGDPNLAKTQSVALLSSIYNRGTMSAAGSEDMLAGIIAAIFDYDINNSSQGILRFTSPKIICDNCGTGGDNINTFHISTTAAVLIATYGVTNDLAIVKHGSPGNAQKSGSSDFFEYVGIDTRTGPERVIQYLNGSNLSYTESIDTRYKCIHVSGQREHRISTMNAIIGPMTNPIEPTELTVKLLGCNQIVPPAVVAEAYKLLNQIGITNVARGLFVRGLIRKNNTLQTIDEVSILNAGTEMALLYRGEVTKIRITFESFGFRGPARLEELIPSRNNAKDRIEYTLRVLDLDAPDGAVNTLIANTAALIALERFDGSSELPDFKGAAIEVRSLLRDKKHEQVISKIKEINSRLNVK